MRLTPRVSFNRTVFINCGKGWFKAQTEDLSLFGIGIRLHPSEVCTRSNKIEVKLPFGKKNIVVKGKIYRKDRKKAVVLFNEDEELLADIIGKFVTGYIKENGKCPYCKSLISKDSVKCAQCKMPLDCTKIDLVKTLKRIKPGDLFLGSLKKELQESMMVEEDIIEFLGSSHSFKKVLKLTKKYSLMDLPVLISGEVGTGKRAIAKYLHNLSSRKGGPFVTVNCSGLNSELIEEELIRYEKGKPKSTDEQIKRKIELADGGTLLLENIEELPLNIQESIANFIETINVRIVASTSKNLLKLVREGNFNKKLFSHLKGPTVKLPPLRERKDDILTLAETILKRFAKEEGKELIGFTEKAKEFLINYPWPGNVRELINAIRKAVIYTSKNYIDVDDLCIKTGVVSTESGEEESFNLRQHIHRLEEELIKKVYKITEGNVSKMAVMLGISRPTVYKLINKYNLTNRTKE